jgi:polyphosphate glucokinase
MKILVIDVGGSNVKLLASGQAKRRKFRSGPKLTAERMVQGVRARTADWKYDAVSLGFPGLVGPTGPRAEPENLGGGWVGFNFARAFGKPVKILNDAAMQALGSYQGGRMLFLGLGTGIGSALVSDKVIVPLEIGRLPFRRKQTLVDFLSREGLKRLGKKAWQAAVAEAAAILKGAFSADYVMLGGGNAKKVRPLPAGCRRGGNDDAFEGGFRLWGTSLAPTHLPHTIHHPRRPAEEWRVV